MTGSKLRAVVIGASAGALDALGAILPLLPENFPCPVFVVVHIPADRDNIIPELLQAKCRLLLKEAEDKEPVRAGFVYFAPPDYHLLVEQNETLSLSNEEPVLYSRPSIDVLFESAADAFRDRLTAVLLTGANSDGASGLRRVALLGGAVLVQDPEGAYARAMPESGMAACPTALCLPLDKIAGHLLSQAGAA